MVKRKGENMTQETKNIISERILKLLNEIEKEVYLNANRFLEVLTDIEFSVAHEFERIEDEDLADVLEFLDQYELPRKLQKKYGLMESGKTVFEVVQQQSALVAKWYGIKIGKKISYFKDKNDLLEILSGRLKNLKIEKIVFNTENSEMIFIAKAGEEI